MKKKIFAYAITHAPRGQKGGPYEMLLAPYGTGTPTLTDAAKWAFRPVVALGLVRRHAPHARVIRIVRKARPSSGQEASAVEVLRDMLATWTAAGVIQHEAFDRARRVLASSPEAGPDPMPVVRAAMRYLDYGPDGRLGPAWVGFREAVEAYRKAGGK